MSEATAVAERDLAAVDAALRAAEEQSRRSKYAVWYFTARLWAARTRVPAWLAALVGSSVIAIFLGLIQILVVGGSLVVLFMAFTFSYAVCGGGLWWLFRSTKIENDTNRVELRRAELEHAKERRRLAMEAIIEKAGGAERARGLLLSLRQAIQTERDEYQMETDRLLGIEAGRLYPDEFERYVAAIFAHLGYAIETTGQTGDQGVDVVACKGTLRLAIQAKRYLGSVGNGAVQEVYAGMAHRRCHRCLVVTNSNFTSGAIALAESTGCLLIGADKIHPLIRGEIPI